MGYLAHQLHAGFIGVGSVVLAVIVLYSARWIVTALWGALVRLLRPAEVCLLQYLQDRATSRTFGVDLDVIRARRKIDSLTVTDRPSE